MNNKRWLQASVAVAVVLFVLEFIIHDVLLQGVYRQTASVWRPEAELESMMWLMWLGYLIFAPFFTLIYAKGYEPRKKGLEQGFRYGVYMAMAMAPMQTLAWYVILPIPGNLAFYWLVAGVVKFVALGITAGLVYRKK